ncbi:serine hydrolase domain-containing protein [Clostridium felsineum]|uniref:Penicillin-binding protein 4 n=1 Tax=Clostridium felsineum TaxID=36839 RepID=A0A1S8L3A2_9CLOT|nr:serine hydrolase domain-containing protein [Clostridium felsineum]URZ07574.1 Penicillin-binding protein 4* [Clostridium felsineum]URZ12605.1 Penicillin-binding protein 4* [Clostridium felsineum]
MMNEKIKQVFEKGHNESGFSGAVLITEGDKEILSYACGYSHIGHKVENNVLTRFDTASITKLFTAVSIFQLIEKKRLSLNDKVLDIIDIGETTISKEVTIYQLLTHTSGIGDDADEEAGEKYEDIWKEKPCYSVRELRDFLPQFIEKPMNFEPGKGCRYNNCAYILLGLVIEKITGISYYDYVNKNIFEKADMKDTGFFSMDDINENVAEGYTKKLDDKGNAIGLRKNIYSYPPKGAADGGAYSTVYDLNKFMKAVISNKLLSALFTKEILLPKEMHRKRIDGSVKYMGFGFEFVLDANTSEIIYITKDGSNAGVSNTIKYYPKEDITEIVLSNVELNIWNLLRKAEKFLF